MAGGPHYTHHPAPNSNSAEAERGAWRSRWGLRERDLCQLPALLQGEVPDAVPLALAMGRRALPAICSETSLVPASRHAQQDFGTWAQEADQRGQLPKVEEEVGGLGHWGWAAGHLLALSVGWSGEQVGRMKGRGGCSQEEPGCQPARMGLLRAGQMAASRSQWPSLGQSLRQQGASQRLCPALAASVSYRGEGCSRRVTRGQGPLQICQRLPGLLTQFPGETGGGCCSH